MIWSMKTGANAQANSKNQFPSQKKISGNSRPSSVSSTVPRRVFSQRETLVQETRTGKTSMQRMADHIAKYFVPAVIFIAISGGVGWYFVGVTGVTFSVTGVTFSFLSFFSVIILAVVLVLLVLLVLQH
jgi:cation transport ATPase